MEDKYALSHETTRKNIDFILMRYIVLSDRGREKATFCELAFDIFSLFFPGKCKAVLKGTN